MLFFILKAFKNNIFLEQYTNNRCWICTHLSVQLFIFGGARIKIHCGEREANKSGHMAAGFVATIIISTPHTWMLTLFRKEC